MEKCLGLSIIGTKIGRNADRMFDEKVAAAVGDANNRFADAISILSPELRAEVEARLKASGNGYTTK